MNKIKNEIDERVEILNERHMDGKIVQVDGSGSSLVEFDDGERGWISHGILRPVLRSTKEYNSGMISAYLRPIIRLCIVIEEDIEEGIKLCNNVRVTRALNDIKDHVRGMEEVTAVK